MSTKERLSAAYPRVVASPFIDEELFAGESEEKWEPHAALSTESPFQSVFGQRGRQMDSSEMEESESFDREDDSETEAGVVGGDNRARITNTSDEEEHFEYDIPTLGSATSDHSLRGIADGQRGQLPDDILTAILTSGESAAKDLTNRVFWQKHSNLTNQTLDPKDQTPKQRDLRKEWGTIFSRQVKPIIWLRQLIDEFDQHRGSIPREFLLGWIAAESDGKVSTVSTLGERGYFQIMWQGGEATAQLGLTKNEFKRLSTDREFSIEKGVQLANAYRQHFLQKYPAVPDGSDLLWRLTKGRHALPTALEKVLDRLVKAGTPITWQAISKSLPKMASRVDFTFDYGAKLKPLADRVPVPAAATPELYAESAPWIAESGYEAPSFEAAAEHAAEENPAEFDQENIWDGETPGGGSSMALLEFDQPARRRTPTAPPPPVCSGPSATTGHWLMPFTVKTIPQYKDAGGTSQATGCAIYVPDTAWKAQEIDLLVFFHGDPGPCVACFDRDPTNRSKKFDLDSQIQSSKRKVALAVPTLFWNGDNLSQIGGKWTAANFNNFVQEVLDEIGSQTPEKRTLGQLIIAGHSRAYHILTPLAQEFNQGAPATTTGHLANSLAEVWAPDSTYGQQHVRVLEVWASTRQNVRFAAVLYKKATRCIHWNNYYNNHSFGFQPPPNLRMCSVDDGGHTHCRIPTKYVGNLLLTTKSSPDWCTP